MNEAFKKWLADRSPGQRVTDSECCEDFAWDAWEAATRQSQPIEPVKEKPYKHGQSIWVHVPSGKSACEGTTICHIYEWRRAMFLCMYSDHELIWIPEEDSANYIGWRLLRLRTAWIYRSQPCNTRRGEKGWDIHPALTKVSKEQQRDATSEPPKQ